MIDVLTTDNKMLEAQVVQQASSSSTSSDRLFSNPQRSPRELISLQTHGGVVAFEGRSHIDYMNY